MEQLQYETTGKPTKNLKREVGRTLQNKNICNDYKTSVCNRANCKRHIKLDDIKTSMTCVICILKITVNNFGAAECGHIFCYDCALQMLSDDTKKCRNNKSKSPICRFKANYIKLM